ncbi:MAG: chemotaxis protein CheA [Desulfuromonas sp.]|uniref:chemotaxis protein CheA n=1 Tax=Desulfuromonas sp. TaxID=892 RepID=UPI000CBFEFDA|nr:chemotaxis protein CheA [Desulfuromonas sp.]PLX84513.1 MAG: chemotaxis protein CheA [Desulfuromonas sp.]
MIDQQKEIFREEANELLAELETSLLELEENSGDSELVAQVFRAMHTIKGSGAMFGFDEVAAFTHEVETVFYQVRNGKLQVTKALVDLSLSAKDHIRSLLDDSGEDPAAIFSRGQGLVDGFRGLLPGACEADAATPEPADAPAAPRPSANVTYRLRIRLPRDIIMRGTRPLSLLQELEELGPCRLVAQTGDIPLLGEIDPESCYAYWEGALTTDRGLNAIRDVFIFVEDDTELTIDVIDEDDNLESENDYKRLGEILIERGDLSPAALQEVLSVQKPLGEMLMQAKGIHPDKIEAALAEQQQVREMRQKRQDQQTGATIRVPAERLDFLVDMVGELVTVQARLSQAAASRNDPDLVSISEEVERLTAELRDSSLDMRMLPIGSTFSKFKRLVRDLSMELGKQIEMATEGAETELDKTVIEKLNDPLIHLIRNSIDHGIETPEDRAALGKPPKGTVHLAATHSGDSVLITIRDDGRGLNRETILAKAVEKGLVAQDAQLSDRELFAKIFAPGFSTAQKVTGVSGRGVGMDVVKRAIDALQGSISLDSEHGLGTTVTIKIPLTLAIVESLLVSIGGDAFVLPLSTVEEGVELTRQDVTAAHGRNLAHVRGQLVPYIPLREQFAMAGETPAIQQIVITQVAGRRVGFVVDHVIGEHHTVIKSLGRLYRDVEGISGATILGDGSVALILDVPKLVREAELLEEGPQRSAI